MLSCGAEFDIPFWWRQFCWKKRPHIFMFSRKKTRDLIIIGHKGTSYSIREYDWRKTKLIDILIQFFCSLDELQVTVERYWMLKFSCTAEKSFYTINAIFLGLYYGLATWVVQYSPRPKGKVNIVLQWYPSRRIYQKQQ